MADDRDAEMIDSMTRNILLFIFGGTLLFFPAFAGAFEVPYERIFQQRGSTIVADRYGVGEFSEYVQCDLVQWSCEGRGTSTPELFPGFTDRRYFLSDDQSFALTVDGAGAFRTYTLHTLDAAGSSAQQIILDFSDPIRKAIFSADNAKILFVTTRGELIVFSIKENIATRSIPIVGGASFIRFSPHGNYIAYYSPSTSRRKARTYTLVDATRGITHTWKEQNTYWDLLSEEEKAFDFSPDERYFLYLSDREGVQTLYSTRLWLLGGGAAGRIGRRMFSSNAIVNNFLYGADGSLYFTANRKNPLTWSLYRYDSADQSVRTVADDVLYFPPPVRVGKFVLFLRSQNGLPALYALHTDTQTVTPLPMPASGSFPLATGTIKNFGGRYGVVYTPDGYEKGKAYPLVVWLHGGPNRQTSPSFHSYHSYGIYDALLEYLRRSGFIVLKLDYRGSYGYGTKFATDLKGNIGKLDVQDVVGAISTLKKMMPIGEVYSMGNSYGGYLALRALAGKPALFSGVISINGVTDWRGLIRDIPSSIFGVHFNGPPSSKNKKLYDQASILLRLNNLRGKKIVLVDGEEDVTIPPKQTTMLYDALKRKGIDATVVSYKEEGHILTDSANLGDLCNRIVVLPNGYGAKTCP